jgi:hypothetical protein
MIPAVHNLGTTMWNALWPVGTAAAAVYSTAWIHRCARASSGL